MKILITGSKGFIGKNLILELNNRGYNDILEYDIDSNTSLEEYCKNTDFVFHLAGVNRPKDHQDFEKVNHGLTKELLQYLENYNPCPIMISSSTQASLDNPYGKSKKLAEGLLTEYHKKTGTRILIYRFPNVFGKWARPNYNSAIATFCHNIAHNLPIKVNDPDVTMNLVYIDDLVKELIDQLSQNTNKEIYEVPIVHTMKLGKIADLIYSFKDSRDNLYIPDLSDPFTKKLYSTYISYLPTDKFSYPLKMNIDERGSFTEFIKTPDRGQVSVNISKPGITKGNHWHHTKFEKFLVVSGKGIIRFRSLKNNETIDYHVNGSKLEVIDIPPGYTHNIQNIGNTDMVTIMWANESFDSSRPDTYRMEV